MTRHVIGRGTQTMLWLVIWEVNWCQRWLHPWYEILRYRAGINQPAWLDWGRDKRMLPDTPFIRSNVILLQISAFFLCSVRLRCGWFQPDYSLPPAELIFRVPAGDLMPPLSRDSWSLKDGIMTSYLLSLAPLPPLFINRKSYEHLGPFVAPMFHIFVVEPISIWLLLFAPLSADEGTNSRSCFLAWHNCDRRFLTFLAILEDWNLLSLNPRQKMNKLSRNKNVFILFCFWDICDFAAFVYQRCSSTAVSRTCGAHSPHGLDACGGIEVGYSFWGVRGVREQLF